jgi:hypothetical protein
MKKLFFVWLIMTIAHSSQGQMVKNPSFEETKDGKPSCWSIYRGARGTLGKELKIVSLGGKNKALQIDDNNSLKEFGVYQNIKLPEGRSFKCTVSVKAVPGKKTEGAFLQVRLFPSRNIFQIPLINNSENEFKNVSLTFITPPKNKSARIYLYTHAKPVPGIIINGIQLDDLGESISDLPKCPKKIPDEWLAPDKHPLFFCTKEELKKVKENIQTSRGQKYLEKQRSICKKFTDMSDAELRALVPKPNCKIAYGLGMNLCPQGTKFRWGGWSDPFKVIGKGNIKYPNPEYPDDGNGCKKNGKIYYFIANANGFIFWELEKVLPALADVYALTGKQKYAHAAAILLDAVAATYPSNRRGPMDYPILCTDNDRGGRLQRAYYMVARGMVKYIKTIDLIAPSGELNQPSLASKEISIKDNLIRNLLWDGAVYCYDFFTNEPYCSNLHNGTADFLRGAAIPWLLLGQRKLVVSVLNSPAGLKAMLTNNIDREGWYSETSPMYAFHAGNLYLSIAEIHEAALRQGWKEVYPVYQNPNLKLFLAEPFNRREVGGHMPSVGDDGPDRYYNSPLYRLPKRRKYVHSDRYLVPQINYAWRALVRFNDERYAARAAALLKNTFVGTPLQLPNDEWAIYHIDAKIIDKVKQAEVKKDFFETDSVFYGAKGLALLRGGRAEKRYGAQLAFGMQNNHSHKESLTWTFFSNGIEWSFDPGYFNTHYRFGWTSQSVAHQALVVNEKSVDCSQTCGFLNAWLDTPPVQWAVAEDPGAYRSEGVSRYQRIIAQISNLETGRLGYWLDIFRIKGGKTRDDSFHTAMTKISLDVDLQSTGKDSVIGDMYKGCKFRRDYVLDKFANKSFYWRPPGEGYGFLKHPESVVTRRKVRAVMTSPGFPSMRKYEGRIVVDFPGEVNREYILAQTSKVRGSVSVPYLLRRDAANNQSSVFAKVIRFVDKDMKDHIEGVASVPVSGGDSLTRAWMVTWKNGAKDLWIAGSGNMLAIKTSELPEVRTNGLLVLIRFKKKYEIKDIFASQAGEVLVAGRKLIANVPSYEGIIEKIIAKEFPELIVKWKNNPGKISFNGMPLITKAPHGVLSSTWRIKTNSSDHIILDATKTSLAKITLTPIPKRPGWFNYSPIISRCDRCQRFLLNKAVYESGKLIGRIIDLGAEGKEFYILTDDKQPLVRKKPFSANISEISPGDRFYIPINSTYRVYSK